MANAVKLFDRRKYRTRNKVRKVLNRPRLSVFRSNKNIYAQIIDDFQGKTLASASTKSKEFKGKSSSNIDAAKEVGSLIANAAKKAKVVEVVFDRGGYIYHGRVKALADSARENGLKF